MFYGLMMFDVWPQLDHHNTQHPFFRFFVVFADFLEWKSSNLFFFLVVATGTSINLPFDKFLVLIKPPRVGSSYKE